MREHELAVWLVLDVNGGWQAFELPFVTLPHVYQVCVCACVRARMRAAVRVRVVRESYRVSEP